MQFITSVTIKGQATIPAPIRRKLDLGSHSKVAYIITDTEVKLKKAPDFLSMKGSIKTNKPFNVEDMDKAIGEHIAKQYGQSNH